MFRTLAVSLLSLLLCASVAFAEKPLVVASDPTFPPNEMLNKDKEIVGFSIDYIKAVGKEAGRSRTSHGTASSRRWPRIRWT